MKRIKIYPIWLVAILFGVACNPIEDESLRKKYIENAGEPITVEELNAALSVTQPFPNVDDKEEGDQYVVLKNSRPDIGGVWHYKTDIGWKITGSDCDTIIYTSNNSSDNPFFEIYYEGISANKPVRSKTFQVTVTNCFDPWDGILSGAKNKGDITAKKTWEFWPGDDGTVYFNGMFGNWQYYRIIPYTADLDKNASDYDKVLGERITEAGNNLRSIHNGRNAWGGTVSLATAGNYTMTFEYSGSKLTTYNPNGSVKEAGNYAFTHDGPDKDFVPAEANKNGTDGFPIGRAIGTLITTNAPMIGSGASWNAPPPKAEWWIIYLNENYMIIAFPNPNWATGNFWDHDCWYGFYRAKK